MMDFIAGDWADTGSDSVCNPQLWAWHHSYHYYSLACCSSFNSQSDKNMVAIARYSRSCRKFRRNTNNKEEQQKQTMELYQKHKINPLGGCLPLLVQRLFFGLFPRLREIPVDQTAVFWAFGRSVKQTVFRIPHPGCRNDFSAKQADGHGRYGAASRC